MSDTKAICSYLLIARTGEKLQTFQHEAAVTHATFSPNGKKVLTASLDKTTIIWPLYQGNIIEIALKKLPANRTCLTPKERKKYFLSNLTNDEWVARGCSQYAKK